MKNFFYKFKWFTVGAIFSWIILPAIVYAVNVTVPQSTQKADLLVGKSNGTYGILNVGTNGLCLIASSTTTSGLVWDSCAAGGVGLSNLNGLTAATQTFSTTTSGTNFTINSSGSNHQFVFPTSPTFATTTQTGAVIINGDTINDFSGTGLTVSGNALQSTLGTSVDLASEITGVLPIANGGTATSTTGTVNGQFLGWHNASWGPWNFVAGSNITLTTTTPGQITIASTGGSGNSAWTIGSGLIYNATSTDLVGIGTITPTTTLFVQGKGGTNPFTIASSTGIAMLSVGQNGTTTIANLNQSSCDVKATTGGALYCGTDTTGASTGNAAWTIGSGLIYNATSTDNVGIGTTTPITTLGIQGTTSNGQGVLNILNTTSAQRETLVLNRTGTGGTSFIVKNSGVSYEFFATDSANSEGAGKFLFLSGGKYPLSIDNGSNVGIGTHTPLSRLYVQGLSGSTTPLFIVASSTSTNLFNVQSNGNVGINTTTPAGKLAVTGNTFLNGTTTISNIAGHQAYLLVSTTTPIYAYSPNYVADLGGNMNDFLSVNVFNNNSGSCATADFTANNNYADITTDFADFGHTSSGYNGTGCGALSIPMTGQLPNSTYLFDPSGAMQFWLGSSTNTSAKYTWGTKGYSTGHIKMTLTPTGELGIGTGTPIATLSVMGTSSQATLPIFNVATSSGASFLQVTANAQILACATCRLTIPQGTAPTLTAVGDIAVDTSNGAMLSFYGNTRENLYATTTKSFFIEAPTATETHKTTPHFVADVPMTIVKVTCLMTSDSNTPSWTFSLPHSTTLGTATFNTMSTGQACTSTTTPQNISIGGDLTLAAGEMVWPTSSAVTLASTTEIMIYLKYDN